MNETLEAQYDQLMAVTQDMPNQLVQDIARVLAIRMEQFKAGEITADEVKATIDVQIETIKALQAVPAPIGDKTPTFHETDVALKVLEIALKLVI